MNEEIGQKLKKRVAMGQLSFDTWGDSERSDIHNYLKTFVGNIVCINDGLYFILFKKGGGCGMGVYPDKVTLINTKIINEIPEIESLKNEFMEERASYEAKIQSMKHCAICKHLRRMEEVITNGESHQCNSCDDLSNWELMDKDNKEDYLSDNSRVVTFLYTDAERLECCGDVNCDTEVCSASKHPNNIR